MERDKKTYRILLMGLLVLCLSFMGCEKEIDDGGSGPAIPSETNVGRVNFNFELPVRRVPANRIHRINLSVALDAHSLYSGYFLESKNVRDLVSTYSFSLKDGEYYYQAGITCSAGGDTCLWDGFSSGQWGTKWTSGSIEVVKGQVLYKNLTFSN